LLGKSDSDSEEQSESSDGYIKEKICKDEIVGRDEDGNPIIIQICEEVIVPISRSSSSSTSRSRENPAAVFANELQRQMATQTAQVGTEITRKNLQIQPTIKIRPGYRFNIMVNKDMLFKEPYVAKR